MKKLILILLLTLLGTGVATAQDAVVRSFSAEPMDVTARQHSRLDLHGVKCAVVKVQVVADGVAFKGNLIGEPVENPGEYWVYLTEGTKQFQILSRSFLPLMYYFPEPLRSGLTYVLTLQAPQPSASSANNPTVADVDITKNYEIFQNSSTKKWGFKHNNNVVIPAQYDWAGEFSEGLAQVIINGKYGHIDKNGAIVVPAKYDNAGFFKNGLALVQIKGRWGYIDKTGNLVISARFDNAWEFNKDLAKVEIKGKYSFIDKTGRVVIPAIYDDAWGFVNGKCHVTAYGRRFYIDRYGNEVE